MAGWTRWRPIEESNDHEAPAIYEVRLAGRDGPTRIARFAGEDSGGILCIGMTTAMKGRHRNFLAGLRWGRGHSEANLLHQLMKSGRVGLRVRRGHLEYRFFEVRTGNEAMRMEERRIKAYVRRFGEVPPLNSAIPRRNRGLGTG